jgi:hypothetical protein
MGNIIMSLRECFERLPLKILINNLSIDKRLHADIFEPSSNKIDNDDVSTLLGILSKRITLETVIEKHINKDRLVEACEILNDLDNKKSFYKRKILDKLKKIRTEIIQRTEDTKKKFDSFINNQQNTKDISLLYELLEKLKKSEKINLDEKITLKNIANHCKVVEELKEITEYLVLYEYEIREKEKNELHDNLIIYNKIRQRIEDYIINEYNQVDDNISKIFCILPSLALGRQKEILKKIDNLTEQGYYDELKNIYLPLASPLSFSRTETKSKTFKKENRFSQNLKNLRSTTEKYWNDILPLDNNFTGSDDVIEFISKTVPLSPSFKESSEVYLRGAKTLLNMNSEKFSEYQGKGFYELAEHLFRKKFYSHSYDLYLDSFSNFLHEDLSERIVYEKVQKTIIGFILSDWAPRLNDSDISMYENKDNLLNNPHIFLAKIVEGSNRDILFHCFDQLNSASEISEFLTFISIDNNQIDWKSIFMERCMQPRIFLRNTNKVMVQIKTLLLTDLENKECKELLEEFYALSNTYIINNRVGFAEISKMQKLNKRYKSLIDKNPNGYKHHLLVLNDRIDLILNTLSNRTPVSSDLEFNCKPVNINYYISEKKHDLELVLNVSLNEYSLPIEFLSISIRVEKKYFKFIEFDKNKIEIGPIEPGAKKEIIFYFNCDDNILKKYNSIPFELIFTDGIKIIEPLDKKKKYDIKIIEKRFGSKSNPYIAGPAIEIGSLYVGRETEITHLKNTLRGQNQDNIPLILGIRRIGKTSLLKRIANDSELKIKYDIIYYDLQDMAESETTSQFLKKLSSKIYELCGHTLGIHFNRKEFDIDPFEAFESYTKQIEKKISRKKILIIFDEFEKFLGNLNKWQEKQKQNNKFFSPSEALIPEVLGSLRKSMIHISSISYIISGLPSIKDSFKEYESRWFGLMTPIEIKPLNKKESKELILAPNIPYKISTEAINEIIYMSGMQPYLLQLICKNLFNFIITSGRETVTLTDVNNTIDREILPNEAYFTDYYKLMGNDEYLLHALSFCHKKVGSKRRFILENELMETLKNFGKKISENDLNEKLNEMTKSDRPLIERNPSKHGSYRIVIGMMGTLLEDKL